MPLLFIKTIFFKTSLRLFLFMGITFVAICLHLCQLDSIPYGMHVDEAGMGYDAFCLANYGVTRDLTKYPVYLANYGGGQSALCAYLAAFLIKYFGPSLFIIRLPMAIFAFLTIIFGALITRETLGSKFTLVSALLLTIFPYFIMQSRFGLDCNLFLGAVTMALFFLIRAARTLKIYWFFLTGLTLGISLYTYALSYIIVPVFFGLSFSYLIYIKRVSLKLIIAAVVPLAFLASPLIIFVIINQLNLPSLQLGPFTIPKLENFRSGELTYLKIFKNIKVILKVSWFKDWLPYNAFSVFYTLYLVSVPFAIKGLIESIRCSKKAIQQKELLPEIFIDFLLLSVIILGLFLGDNGPNINKLNGMYIAWAYMVLKGLIHIYYTIAHKKAYVLLVILLYLISFLTFVHFYFYQYPAKIYPQYLFYPELKETVPFIEELNSFQLPVYYPTEFSYIYYAFAEKLSPFEANITSEGVPQIHNNHFYWPSEMPLNAIYVIWEKDTHYIEQLEKSGFVSVLNGAYKVYLHMP